MVNDEPSTLMEDEYEIASLLVRWGHARDSDDWETLAECFHEDATIHISWMSGTAKEFVGKSRAMAAARRPGAHTKHLISGIWTQMNRERAFSRCHANIYVRGKIDSYEFDLESWIRFFDLLEKRNGSWRIVKRTAVYEKDRMDPVDPRGFPEDFLSSINLSSFPASAKFLCYWIRRCGGSPSNDLISVYSDKERALRQESESWLKRA
jgi:3-phenylpropionate/cinnamic acid dioxygenase small subunit